MKRTNNDLRKINWLAAASLSKEIEVIDVDGNPLEGAHVIFENSGTVTNQNGIAIVTVESENTQVTVSYLGKRSHIARFKDLGGLITLQENPGDLPPVNVSPVQKTNKKMLQYAAIGIGAIFLISMILKSGKKKGLKQPVVYM